MPLERQLAPDRRHVILFKQDVRSNTPLVFIEGKNALIQPHCFRRFAACAVARTQCDQGADVIGLAFQDTVAKLLGFDQMSRRTVGRCQHTQVLYAITFFFDTPFKVFNGKTQILTRTQ